MTDDAHRKAISGEAWAEFCDTLKDAGQLMLEHSTDDLDRRRGVPLPEPPDPGRTPELHRERRSGVRRDPAHRRTISRSGATTPTPTTTTCRIDPTYDYRIHGLRGTVNYLSIGAYSGGYGAGATQPGRQGHLEDNDPDPERVVDIIASVDEPVSLEPGQRWLRMSCRTRRRSSSATSTSTAPPSVPSELALDVPQPAQPPSGPLTGKQLSHGLAMSALFVHGVADSVPRLDGRLPAAAQHPRVPARRRRQRRLGRPEPALPPRGLDPRAGPGDRHRRARRSTRTTGTSSSTTCGRSRSTTAPCSVTVNKHTAVLRAGRIGPDDRRPTRIPASATGSTPPSTATAPGACATTRSSRTSRPR